MPMEIYISLVLLNRSLGGDCLTVDRSTRQGDVISIPGSVLD